MKFDVENFITTIPAIWSLPPLLDNIAEGVVIRPVTEKRWPGGSARLRLKIKSSRFREITGPKRPPRIKPASAQAHRFDWDEIEKDLKNQKCESLVPVIEELLRYVNENRLRNVLSKCGPIEDKKGRMNKIAGLLSKDALDDFRKDTGFDFNAQGLKVEIEEKNEKEVEEEIKKRKPQVTHTLNSYCLALVSQHWAEVLAGNF